MEVQQEETWFSVSISGPASEPHSSTMVDYMGGIYRMQLGHVPLRGEGRIGTGGAVDCVEAYASGAVLQSLARKYGLPVNQLFAVSPAGDLNSELDTFLRDQALTIAMAVTLTDPEVVVIGGGVIDMDGYPFNSLIQAVHSCLSPVLGKDRIVLTRAALGSAAATWGALSLLTNAEGQMRVEIAERRPTGASAAKIERE